MFSDPAMIVFYLTAGMISGFMAGLLGLGGGVIVVPILTAAFNLSGFDSDVAIRMALGTSLGAIIFTSLASLKGHQRYNAVRWPIVARLLPGIVLGTVMGAGLSNLLPNRVLKIFFAFFLVLVVSRVLRGPRPAAEAPLPSSPSRAGSWPAGLIIGAVASLVGVGGGTMVIPYLTGRNLNLREAVGTSAGLILPISFFGALGYLLNGWGHPGLPGRSLGYLYLPALAPLALASIWSAPLGARLAHRLPVKFLKRLFCCFLLLIALSMFIGALKP